jgi:hypothetical protein
MKSQHQRLTRKMSPAVRRKSAKARLTKAATSDARLVALYSRLDKTKPGSKESKAIADEIIDAIG